MIRHKFFVIFIVLMIMALSGCIQRVERQTKIDYSRYFPLSEGNEYIYSGISEKAVVTGEIGDLFTLTYYDTAGNIIRREDYLKKETGVRFKSIVVSDSMPISRYYEPSLPFGPWSNLIGDTLLVNSVEIRFDSNNTHIPVTAEFQIVAIETMVTLSGSYDNCIKIRRLIKTAKNSDSEIADEESFWWFAPDIGLVRSKTGQGSRELIKAVIGGVSLP
jgi:hypothetical protein